MQLDPSLASILPDTLQPALAGWLAELRGALGEELVSLVVYGGLARGEFDPERSDVNLMVVVREAGAGLLERLGPLVRRGARDVRAGVFLITESELRGATDVFPVKFLDIQRHHRLLAGRDVLSALTFARGALRLRAEQELRNLVLNLRRLYLQQAHLPERIETLLTRSVSRLLVNLSVLQELRTGRPAPGREALLERMKGLGLDPAPLREALALRRGQHQPGADELRQAFCRFLESAEKAAHLADEMEEEP